jgi:hypothetical protein
VEGKLKSNMMYVLIQYGIYRLVGIDCTVERSSGHCTSRNASVFFSVSTAFCQKMRKTVLLDIYLLYTAESCSRRIPTTGCPDMKFSEENRSFTASAML